MKRFLAMLLSWLISMQVLPAKELTMDDVRRFAAMKEEIEWLDLAPYGGVEVGSGMFILSFPVDGGEYYLQLGMDWGSDDVMYLHLRSGENNRSYMDLWTEDIDAFLNWDHRIGRYRYDRMAEMHLPGEPGVNPYPFQNTTAMPVFGYEAVLSRAKEEVTIEYNAVEMTYDPAADVWQVVFYIESSPGAIYMGGGQSVYLGSDGITKLIVYEE